MSDTAPMPLAEPDKPRPSPVLRVSDAERQQIVAELQEHCAQGRLTVEEFTERAEEALAARTQAELERALRELPQLPPRHLSGRPVRTKQQRDFARHVASYLLVNVFLVLVWVASGDGYFWPVWAILGWGLAVAFHALRAYGPFADEE